MRNRQMLFLYNPSAGRGTFKTHLSDVIDLFVKAGYDVVVHPTQAKGDAFETVRTFRYPYDSVGCCGGDGTLDAVVAGMIKRVDRIPIGYIPAGTVNDFASSLHIPKQTIRAARQIVEGVPFPFDVGQMNDSTFVYVAAFGMFTDVSYETSQEVKNMIGQAAYILEGVRRLSKVPKHHVRVSYEGGTIEDDFVLGMVTNTKSVGGFRSIIGSKVFFDDGEFEVTLVKYPKNLLELQAAMNALINQSVKQTMIKGSDGPIIQFRSSDITFDSFEEIKWTRDGEYGGTYEHVEVKNLPRALRIMVDPNALEKISEQSEEMRRV